jgi:ATP-binding cassette, subfamily B, multidrug efflux pump
VWGLGQLSPPRTDLTPHTSHLTPHTSHPVYSFATVRDLVVGYLHAYRAQWLLGFVFTVASTGLGLVTPWLLRQAIDTFAQGTSPLNWPLHFYALAIVGVALFEAASRFTSRYVITGASRWVEYDLRNRYFEHLETLEPAFFVRFRTGDLVARATNDLSAVRQLFGSVAYHVLNTTLLLGIALLLMFQLSPRLAVWAVLVVPAASAVFVVTRARIEQRFTRVQEQFAAMSDHAQETFAGQRVVKAYAQEAAEVETFRGTSNEYVRRQLSQIRLTGLLWPSMSLVVGLLIVLMLYLGGREVVDGRLTLGEFVQFNAYVGMLAWPMMALGWVGTMWQQGAASLRRLHEVFSISPTISSGASPVAWTPAGRIEFRNVTLVLGDRAVLRDINLTIPAGTTYAVVGPLGAGKSSLVSLIPRLQDVTSGQVLVDGIDVRELPLDELRRRIGFVPQETFLFSGSLRENVGFGLAEAEVTEPRVRAAVRLSQLENDLDQWPAGLDTIIGERGVTLSGGQKQRTAIARAVAKDPNILILDDALSSVDTRTEEAVLEGLHEFMADRTSLVIAHRLSTTRSAECVVVMDGGRIVELGTHAELLERQGLYARIYRRQLIAQELDVDEEALA